MGRVHKLLLHAHTSIMAQELCKEKDIPLYDLYIPTYTRTCYVEKKMLPMANAKVLRGYFQNDEGRYVALMILTSNFFKLHHANNQKKLLFC